MRDMTYQQGETIRLTVTVEEEGAETAEFVANDGTVDVINSLASFDGLTADISTSDTDITPGSYNYYIRVTWDDGTIDILPDTSNCDGECEFPQLIICEIPGVS